MKKIYSFSAAILLSASMMAQSITLQEPTKINLNAKANKGLNSVKETETFLDNDFQDPTSLDTYTLDQASGSVGFELDSSRISDALFIPELNNASIGEPTNIFAVSNDSKSEALNGSNDASMDYLTTSALDFTGMKDGVILQFDYFANDLAAVAVASFSVEISVDGTAFTSLLTPTIDSEWQSAYIDLSAYSTETSVVLRFGHNDGAGTMSAFAIDNLDIRSLETDLTLAVTPNHSLTKITDKQNRPINFEVAVSNNGLKDEAAIVLAGTVTDPLGAVTNYDLTFSLSAENDTVITFGPYNQVELGDYAVSFTIDAGNEETTNDNSFAYTTNLNDSILTRDNGDYNIDVPVGNNVDVGVGIPGNLLASSRYSFVAGDTITGVTFIFDKTAAAGASLKVNLYGSDGAGAPDFANILATSPNKVKTAAVGTEEMVTVKVGTGGIYAVAAGDTVFAVVQMPTGITGVASIGGDTTGFNVDGTSELYFFIPQFGLTLPFGLTDAPIIRLETKSIDLSTAVADLEVSNLTIANGYYATPINQVEPLTITLDVENIDLAGADGTSVEFNIDNAGGNVFTQTDAIGTVAAGAGQTLTYTFTPSAVGIYTISALVSTTSPEDTLSNNSIELKFSITDSVYSRFDGVLAGNALIYGIADVGAGLDTIEVGTSLKVVEADTITAVRFLPNPTFKTGDVFYANVYDANDVLVARSENFVAAANANPATVVAVRVTFAGTVVLPAGDYFVEVGTIQTGTPGAANRKNVLLSNGFYKPGIEYLRYNGTKLLASDNSVTAMLSIYAEFGTISTVGINENTGATVTVFPNPATDVLNITNAAGSEFVLFNITGKTVMTGSINNDSKSINVSALNSGVYVLQLKGAVNESSRVIID